MDRPSASPKWGLNREASGEFMPTLDFAGADRRSSSVRNLGGSETHRLSERRGAVIQSVEIPSPIGSAGPGSDGFPERKSPGSRSPVPGTSRFSPHHRDSDVTGKSGFRTRAWSGAHAWRGGLRKGKWRTRVKWSARVLFACVLFYYFGRTAYQLSFFVKAGLNRYWYHPLESHRPIPCGVGTPPVDPFLAPLARRVSPKDVDDGAKIEATTKRAGRGRSLRVTDDETYNETYNQTREYKTTTGRSLRGTSVRGGDDDTTADGPGGGRRVGPRGGTASARPRRSDGSRSFPTRDVVIEQRGDGYSAGAVVIGDTDDDTENDTDTQNRPDRNEGTSVSALALATATDVVGVGSVGSGFESGFGGGGKKHEQTEGARFAVLTLCDANAGYICAASAANKRRYCDLHGYDLIVSRTAADPTRPAAWSKILEMRKHLPRYDWVLFIDVDTLIMNPTVRLEEIADNTVDQVIGADHNGVNSGVWLVRNAPWSFFFLDELWAQDDLVKGAYLFHYEQRAFHRLFHTDPWSKQVSVRGTAPYSGAAEVRRHSKIVNQCVFNSLLPWYVSGDFVVHFAGLKGVWECLIFFSYFDKSQEAPGMRVSDAQWAEELGGENRGKASQMWECMQFKTLFR